MVRATRRLTSRALSRPIESQRVWAGGPSEVRSDPIRKPLPTDRTDMSFLGYDQCAEASACLCQDAIGRDTELLAERGWPVSSRLIAPCARGGVQRANG